jgi:hypothetical protein
MLILSLNQVRKRTGLASVKRIAKKMGLHWFMTAEEKLEEGNNLSFEEVMLIFLYWRKQHMIPDNVKANRCGHRPNIGFFILFSWFR